VPADLPSNEEEVESNAFDEALEVCAEPGYRSAGITSINHDFYPSGRHEMLHELNRREVVTNLLVWISGVLQEAS